MPDNSINTGTNKIAEVHSIQNQILTIRGHQVLLDRDLAAIYGVETRQLNQQVKRNLDRFPEDFMFQLTENELEPVLISQNVTSSWGGIRKPPYAFTENGVAMLSGVLRSPSAVQANIAIMRAFNAMRHFLTEPLFTRIETIEHNQLAINNHLALSDKRQDMQENQLAEVLRRLDAGEAKPQQGVFFDGQVFDAYEFVSGLIEDAKQRIVLIDNYIDAHVLGLLSKRAHGVTALVYTAKIDARLQADISKYAEQYEPIEVHEFRQSHDRFLCIDEAVYLIGASIKDLGKKWFGFSRLYDIAPVDLIRRISISQALPDQSEC